MEQVCGCRSNEFEVTIEVPTRLVNGYGLRGTISVSFVCGYPMTRNETIAKLARRSISDRMQVIEKLWETLPEDHDPIELTDEQIAIGREKK